MAVPPRLDPLLQQFDFALDRLVNRLDGLTDAEYFWEPVPNCWSVRRRSESTVQGSIGSAGEWVLEHQYPAPKPPPFTTIAWRINHLIIGFNSRADYTVGTHSVTDEEFAPATTAEDAIGALVSAGAFWRSALDPTTDADLDRVGHSSFPHGLDPTLPFLDIAWWVNQELLHHGAEIALLRDLYRDRERG